MVMSPQFRDYVIDLLSTMGPVRARRMFGGGGLYLDDTMFAIVADDELYFKTDNGNRGDFEAAGAKPFSYTRGEKTFAMSYHRVPEEVMEEPDDLSVWARRAWDAARRSGTKKKNKKGKPKNEHG